MPNPLLVPTAPNAVSSVDDFLLSKALKPSAVCAPTKLISPLTTHSEWAVEIIYLLRPLLYGAFTLRTTTGMLMKSSGIPSAVHHSVIKAEKNHFPSDNCLASSGSFTAISAKAGVTQLDVGAS